VEYLKQLWCEQRSERWSLIYIHSHSYIYTLSHWARFPIWLFAFAKCKPGDKKVWAKKSEMRNAKCGRNYAFQMAAQPWDFRTLDKVLDFIIRISAAGKLGLCWPLYYSIIFL